MTPSEVAKVLAKCAAYDRRTVGEMDVRAWHEILAAVELPDALAAVTLHYRRSSDWAMPSDILEDSREAKRARLRQLGRQAEPLALPSRYENDAERDARYRRGRAMCEDAVQAAKAKASMATPEEPTRPAIEVLRDLTPGPEWVRTERTDGKQGGSAA